MKVDESVGRPMTISMSAGQSSTKLPLLLVAGEERCQPSPTSQCRAVSSGEVSEVWQPSTQKPPQASTGQHHSSCQCYLQSLSVSLPLSVSVLCFLYKPVVQFHACMRASVNTQGVLQGRLKSSLDHLVSQSGGDVKNWFQNQCECDGGQYTQCITLCKKPCTHALDGLQYAAIDADMQ